MAEIPSGAPPPADAAGRERLDSWKEIAGYLKRDVTTVQRWEKREGMPVRRHLHDKLGSVYAYRSELDAWTHTRAGRESDAEPLAGSIDQSPAPADEDDTPEIAASPQPAVRGRRRPVVLWVAAAAALAVTAIAAWQLLRRADYFWRDPLAQAQFQTVTDFGGSEQAAALSPDGRFVAFLSDRDGQVDVWVTQVGTGRFYNLTRGSIQQLVNPSIRMLGFSPDGALVTFWRGQEGSTTRAISIWAAPLLGGEARPYVEGAAEYDWSDDGSRLVFHTPGPGDPMFLKDAGQEGQRGPVFTAAAGLHAHYPLWSPDGAFIYFVQGSPPDAMDIWRIRSAGGAAERITSHNARVSHPVMLDDRTLMYLTSHKDGTGPWLYAMDVMRRTPHQVGSGPGRYTSLATSADGRRLVASVANTKGTLWRVKTGETPVDVSAATPVSLTTGRGFSPRLGPGYLLYVSSRGTGDGLWKLVDGTASELWSAPDARFIGGPEIAPDGRHVAFSVEQRGKRLLYVVNADGTEARVVTGSLQLHGAPAWAPDGQSITAAADENGQPHLFRISLDGAAVPLVKDYAVDPAWSPGGEFLVYSGPDVGTMFAVKAITADAKPYPIPNLLLTRGARRVRFSGGRRSVIVMRGEIQHKNLWLIDLGTGVERQLTNLPPDFDVRDFDISADGREIVLERVQETSNVVLIDRSPGR